MIIFLFIFVFGNTALNGDVIKKVEDVNKMEVVFIWDAEYGVV